MKKPILLLWFTFLLIFQGCARTPALPEVTQTSVLTTYPSAVSLSTVMPVISNTPTASSTLTPIPTLTPAFTSTNLPTVTLTPTQAFRQSCLTVLPAAPDGKTYPGKIILVEEGVYVNVKDIYEKPFFYDPSSGETTVMTPEKILDIAVSPERRFFSEKYSWSPDGRYLAFWHESVRNRTIEATFAVLDTDTGNETNYCISAGNLGGSELPYYYTPIWSSDGKSLVIVANRNEVGDFDTVLVDLEGGFAVKIAENLTPGGWLDVSQK